MRETVMTTSAGVRTRIVVALAMALSLGVLAGCTSTTTTGTSTSKPKPVKSADTSTAKTSAEFALSELATIAPDGKILLGDSVAPVPATATPIWQFFVASEKKAMVYTVLVTKGKAQHREYAKITLKAAEWAKVPALSAWKIDSGEARLKALTVYPQGKNAQFISQFLTYRPEGASKTGAAKPMTWQVTFDPASNKSKAPTTTILVDMVTGAASFAK
jgi:hypothetical protein